jgi:hypothetical protein
MRRMRSHFYAATTKEADPTTVMGSGETGRVVTIYGVVAVTFMMTMYALERRGRRYVLAFAVGCILSSVYGFLSGAWPFGIVELIWSGVAVRRYKAAPPTSTTI